MPKGRRRKARNKRVGKDGDGGGGGGGGGRGGDELASLLRQQEALQERIDLLRRQNRRKNRKSKLKRERKERKRNRERQRQRFSQIEVDGYEYLHAGDLIEIVGRREAFQGNYQEVEVRAIARKTKVLMLTEVASCIREWEEIVRVEGKNVAKKRAEFNLQTLNATARSWKGLFERIIAEVQAKMGWKDGDYVQMYLRNPYHPGSYFRHAVNNHTLASLKADVVGLVMNPIAKWLTSAGSFSLDHLYGATIDFNKTTASRNYRGMRRRRLQEPSGGATSSKHGRRFMPTSADEFAQCKKSYGIVVNRDDKLCGVYALLLAKAWDHRPRYEVDTPEFAWLREEATALLKEAGVVPGGEGLTPSQMEVLAKHLDVYLFVLFGVGGGVQAFNVPRRGVGDLDQEAVAKSSVYLHLNRGHWNVVFHGRLHVLLGTKKFCHGCRKGYDKEGRHVCRQRKCQDCHCDRSECPQQHGTDGRTYCGKCHLGFRSVQCFRNHQKSGMCQKRYKCMKCKVVITRGHSPSEDFDGTHKCGYIRCKNCDVYEPIGEHRCTMQRKKKKESDGRLAFIDFETVQETGVHEVNLSVSQYYVPRGGEETHDDDDGTDPGGLHEVVHESIGDFCTWAKAELAGYTLMAHNSRGFDAWLIVEWLCKNKVKYSTIKMGGKILVLRILPGTKREIRMIDFLSFVQGRLADMHKVFGLRQGDELGRLTNMLKGRYPIFFNKRANRNYRGRMPSTRFYGLQYARDTSFDKEVAKLERARREAWVKCREARTKWRCFRAWRKVQARPWDVKAYLRQGGRPQSGGVGRPLPPLKSKELKAVGDAIAKSQPKPLLEKQVKALVVGGLSPQPRLVQERKTWVLCGSFELSETPVAGKTSDEFLDNFVPSDDNSDKRTKWKDVWERYKAFYARSVGLRSFKGSDDFSTAWKKPQRYKGDWLARLEKASGGWDVAKKTWKRDGLWLADTPFADSPIPVEFDNWQELVAYCRQDVNVLRLSAMRFRKIFLKTCGVDPFRYNTIASFCFNGLYRTDHLPEGKIGVNFHKPDRQSLWAVSWMEWHAKKTGMLGDLKHAMNGGEVKLLGSRVDGFLEPIGDGGKRGVVLRGQGCFYHGCPHGCFDPEARHPTVKNRPTYRRLLERSDARTKLLREEGYEVVEMWQCQWKKLVKQSQEIRDHVAEVDAKYAFPLNVRDAYFGGRTEARCLSFDFPDPKATAKNLLSPSVYPEVVERLGIAPDYDKLGDWKAFYLDYTSLYPFLYGTKELPCKHPTIIVGEERLSFFAETYVPFSDDRRQYDKEKVLAKLSEFFGVIKLTIHPPSDLWHPVLPERRAGGRLVFDLTPKVAKTYNLPEVVKAVKHGYRIERVYEIHHFEETSCDLFTSYLRKHYKMKLTNDGFAKFDSPKQVGEFLSEYVRRFGIRITLPDILRDSMILPDGDSVAVELDDDGSDLAFSEDVGEQLEMFWRKLEVKHGCKLDWTDFVVGDKGFVVGRNDGLRSCAKLAINALYGRFGMRSFPKTVVVRSMAELDRIYSNPRVDVESISTRLVGEDQVEVCFKMLDEEDGNIGEDDHDTNVYIASFITCYGRLILWDTLHACGKRAVYCDTDSCVVLWRGTFESLADHLGNVGEHLGDLKNELSPGDFIVFWKAVAGKTYHFRTMLDVMGKKGGQNVVHCKGFNLNALTARAMGETAHVVERCEPEDDPLAGEVEKRVGINPGSISALLRGDLDEVLVVDRSTLVRDQRRKQIKTVVSSKRLRFNHIVLPDGVKQTEKGTVVSDRVGNDFVVPFGYDSRLVRNERGDIVY